MVEGGKIVEFGCEKEEANSILGNIYVANSGGYRGALYHL